MKNFIESGKAPTLTAPAGGIVSGKGFLDGLIFAIAAYSADAGAPVVGNTSGVYEIDKAASQAWAVGDVIYWDNANKVATNDPASGGLRIGLAMGAVAGGAGDVLGRVKLDGTSLIPGVYHIRRRFTTAEVNAGAALLPALPGVKYRMIDSYMIAIGGNAATATSVDIIATASATPRKLVAAAVAGLTQSAVARAGASNIAVLADGASFTANDANTAITVGKTGSDLATATAVDVSLTFAVEG